MTLAASLLEGYGYIAPSVAGAYGSSEQFIQNATADFIMESSNLFQTYLTSEIIAQTKVLTEGAEPEVLLEGTVTSYVKKMWGTIKKFVAKIKNWILGVIKRIKDKWKSWKSSKMKKEVDAEIKKRDDDEKIPVPQTAQKPPMPALVSSTTNAPRLEDKGSDDLYPIIGYDIDGGRAFFEKLIDSMEEVDGGGILDLLDDPTDINKVSDDFKYNTLDDFKNCIKRKIGFDPDNVDYEMIKAFNADKIMNVSLTVSIFNTIAKDADTAEKAIESINKGMDRSTEVNKRIERKWETISKTLSLPDQVLQKLQTVYTCTTYYMQFSVKTLTAAQNILQAYLDQVNIVYSLVYQWVNGESAVGEGYDPTGDGFFGDPVSEGVNMDVLKKYLTECRGYIKDLKNADKLFKKEDYAAAKKAYKEVKTKMEKTNKDLTELAADADLRSDIIGDFTGIITAIVVGFDQFIRNCWINKDIMTNRDVMKAQDATHGSKNTNITVVMSKMNACIERCDRQMVACDKRSSVSESSLFEQASTFIF